MTKSSIFIRLLFVSFSFAAAFISGWRLRNYQIADQSGKR